MVKEVKNYDSGSPRPFRVWGRGDSRLRRFGVRLPHRRGGRRSRSSGMLVYLYPFVLPPQCQRK
ncbi:unnamed protein product [Musa acuminata subsp. malaccensis]|uniref:(wild Malaysian banana) hypothetical protein n=1 Tax=Musa acuminata subsp. malaccensis TaxID=214687 RepID=A0A804L003_MUSAM|nr:unnamed protein product [Musa acuminata subsp. malaccensis]